MGRRHRLAATPLALETGTDIAIDEDGIFWLANFDRDVLLPRFYTLDVATGDLTLQFTDTSTDGESAGPRFFPGITFSASGDSDRLYAYEANSFEDIYRYDLPAFTSSEIIFNFTPTAFNAGRGDLAAFMVAAPPADAPEPGTLVAALAGLAAVGLARRRRRA